MLSSRISRFLSALLSKVSPSCDINVGFRHQVNDITIYCYDITGKIDDVGATVNAVIFLRLSSRDKSSIGGVTIHLHHTVRKVQVQGSSMVNSRTRAGVWFVESYLLAKFTFVSLNKSFDIASFNTAVKNLVSNHIEKINEKEKCEVCHSQYIGRSVREYCQNCNNSFHKKCYLGHPCTPAPYPLVRPGTQPPASIQPIQAGTSSPSNQAIASSKENTGEMHTLLQPVPPATSLPPSDAGNASLTLVSLMQSNLPGNYLTNSSHTNTYNSKRASLDPTQPPFIPSTAGPSSYINHSLPKVQKAKSKTKPGISTTKDGIDLEFAKIEINTVRARLKIQETTIKDLEFQNSILLERIAVFEKAEKDTINDRYFPKAPEVPSSSHFQTPNPSSCCNCCCQRQKCCQSQQGCQTQLCHKQPRIDLQSSSSSHLCHEFTKTLTQLQKDVLFLKSKVGNHAKPPDYSTSQPNKPPEDFSSNVPKEGGTDDFSENCTNLGADDSVITIEENLPDLSSEEYLN